MHLHAIPPHKVQNLLRSMCKATHLAMELMARGAPRPQRLEDSATSLLLVSCTPGGSGQAYTATFLLRFHVGFVHTPADPYRSLAPMEGFLELWAVFDHPAVDRRVIHVNPTFEHQFFDMACTQRIRLIPADAGQNELLGEEWAPLKLTAMVVLPHGFNMGHSERAHISQISFK